MRVGDKVRVYGGRFVCRVSGVGSGHYAGAVWRSCEKGPFDLVWRYHTGPDATDRRGGGKFPLHKACWPNGEPTKGMSRETLLTVGIVVTREDGHSRRLCGIETYPHLADAAIWERLDKGRRRTHMLQEIRDFCGVPEYGGIMDVKGWLAWCRKKGAMAVVP